MRILPTDVEEIAERLEIPALEWAGRCYEIAIFIRGVYDLDARACYGHWKGRVAKGGLFDPKCPIHRHGWLELPDLRIYDPTRWVFEVVEPYIYVGPNDHYDEGGDELRQQYEKVRVRPDVNAYPEKVLLVFSDTPEGRKARAWVEELFDARLEQLNFMQVVYLGNLSRRTLGDNIKEIYQAIVKAGHRVIIPLDNRLLVLCEECG